MMVCALEGAMAFQKGLGAVHALTHPLGAIRELNLHHGTLNAVLMPEVLRFNRDSIGEKWDVLAKRMGGEPDKVVEALNVRIGMPSGLAELSIDFTAFVGDCIARRSSPFRSGSCYGSCLHD